MLSELVTDVHPMLNKIWRALEAGNFTMSIEL